MGSGVEIEMEEQQLSHRVIMHTLTPPFDEEMDEQQWNFWEQTHQSRIYHLRLRIHHLALLREHVNTLPDIEMMDHPDSLYAPSRPPPYELLSARR